MVKETMKRPTHPPIITEVFGIEPGLTRLESNLYRVDSQFELRPRGSRLAFVLTGPTGSGKDTVRDLLPAEIFFPFKTVTSRPRRSSEPGGERDPYHRLSEAEFLAARERSEFFETNNFAGHWYGGRHADVEGVFSSGLIPVFRPDPQGAANYLFMAESGTAPFADMELVVVFLLPPMKEDLAKRLYLRDVAHLEGTPEFAQAKTKYESRVKIAEAEIHRAQEAHYVLINKGERSAQTATLFESLLGLHR